MLNPAEASSDYFAACCYYHKGVRVGLADKALKLYGFKSATDGVDRNLPISGISPADLGKRCVVMKIFYNVIGYDLRLGRDNVEVFAGVYLLNNAVHQKRFCEKTYLNPENKEGACGYQKVNAKQRFSYIERGKLFQNKRNYIRSSRGSAMAKDYCRAYGGQKHGIYQFEEGLARKRLAERKNPLKNL